MRVKSAAAAIFLLLLNAGAEMLPSPLSLESDCGLRQKIGQMLLIGFRGTSASPDSEIIKILKEIPVGGVVLFDYDVPSQSFPRNIIDAAQTKKLIDELQAASEIPLLVAVDVEGGRVNRLKEKYGFMPVPSAKAMNGKSRAEAAVIYRNLARQIANLGFNLNLAPVVDLDLHPDNPVIGKLERSYSARPDRVTEMAAAFIRAHSESKVGITLKHFPGHGSSKDDSHLGMVDITETFQPIELEPYRQLISKFRIDAVMTAHVINRKMDPQYPATLSQKILNGLLRRKLGYQGVIISDDMQMGAILEHFGFEDALVRAVNAGCDLLALANNGKTYIESAPYDAFKALLYSVKKGNIPIETIDRANARILNLKKRLGLIR